MTLELPPPTMVRGTNSLDRVLEALDRGGWKYARQGGQYMAVCPIHGDRNPSLAVRYDGAAGKVILFCHGCGDGFNIDTVRSVCAALGLTLDDLFDAPRPKRTGGARTARPRKPSLPPRVTRDELARPADDLTGAVWREVTVYEYADADGVVQQRVHREEAMIGRDRHKQFTQSYRSPAGRWVKRKPEGFTPLLYNLRQVRDAASRGDTIWVLEGEKDADTAIALGLVGTTNAGGAGSFPTELLQEFRGGRVHVVIDNDAAGAHRAVTMASRLLALQIPTRVFLPDLDDRKSDFTDHITADGTADTLIEISIDDARALVAAAEAERVLDGPAGVAVCQKEALAQLELTEQDRGTSEQHAERWAREALARFDRLVDLAADIDVAQLGERGRQAWERFDAARAEAGQVVRETYAAVGLDAPTAVRDAPTVTEQVPHLDDTTTVEAPQPLAGGGGDGRGVFFGNNAGSGAPLPKKRAHINRDNYAVVDGKTVLVKYVLGDDGEWKEKYELVMNGSAILESVSIEDDGTDSEIARVPHLYTVKFSRWVEEAKDRWKVNPDSGLVETETITLRFDRDQVRDGSWADAVPWPGLLRSLARRSRDQAWDAIRFLAATTHNDTVHSTVGWRDDPVTGPFFVHAGGGIGPEGAVEIDVDVDRTSQLYVMAAPTLDRAALRQAWDDGTATLMESGLPARVIAPLLGHSWTAPVLPGSCVVHLQGEKAAFKTSHGRLALQYFAPTLTRHTKGLISGANGGSTTVALQRVLGAISHVPVLVDDFAPDGDAKAAIRRVGSLARQVFNGIGKLRGKQRGGVESDRPVVASVITTGELAAQGSADSRIVNLSLDASTLTDGGRLFGRLESRRGRDARGAIGSALVQWIAQRRTELVAQFTDAEDDSEHPLNVQDYWRGRIPAVVGHGGLFDRVVEAAIALDRGITVMLMMLRDLDVLDEAEADAFNAWARDGIAEAIGLQDPGASDPAEQLLDYLREAIGNGTAHLAGPDGVHPFEDASALGWVDSSTGLNKQWRPNGQRVGIINGERLYLLPRTAIAIANLMSQRADETFSESSVSIASSLQSHGWLEVDAAGKRSVVRRIGRTVQQRVWDIPLRALLGVDRDDTPDGTDPDADGGPDDSQPSAPVAPSGVEAAIAPAAPVDELEPDEDLVSVATAAAPPSAGHSDAAPAPRGASRGAAGFRAPLGVLDTDGLWLPSGELVRVDRPLHHAGDLAQLATDLQLGTRINNGTNGARLTERGQIYLTRAAALALGIPLDGLPASTDSDYTGLLRERTKGIPFLADAAAAGFTMTGDGAMGGTIDIWRDTAGAHIALLPAQNSAFIDTVLRGNPSPATIARRLGQFTAALKFPYRSSAGTTGTKLMTALVPGDRRQELFHPQDRPLAIQEQMLPESDFNWQRRLTDGESEQHWVHGFDRGGSYLAATSVELGIGAPTHLTGPLEFTPQIRKPGYWLVTVPETEGWRMPDLFARGGVAHTDLVGSQIWITTPTLELAAELELELQIHEAWVWERSSKVLEGWYRRVRDARTALDTEDPDDQAARDLLKRMYTAAIGMLDYRGRHDQLEVWAPHRHDTIIAKSRANILRRIINTARLTGSWPVAVEKDTLVYTSDHSDPVEAWPGDPGMYGRGLGQFKHEGIDTVKHHAPFLTGGSSYRGKQHLGELI